MPAMPAFFSGSGTVYDRRPEKNVDSGAADLAGSVAGRGRRCRRRQVHPMVVGDAAGVVTGREAVDAGRVAGHIAGAVAGPTLELVGIDALGFQHRPLGGRTEGVVADAAVAADDPVAGDEPWDGVAAE